VTCILRVWGTNLAVDELAAATSLEPYRIDRRGEPRRDSSRVFEESCVHFEVSDLDFHELEGQARDAIQFLDQYAAQLRAIMSFPGVQGAVLDFGIAWRDVMVQTDQLPADLLKRAGTLGIGIDLSHYPVSEPGSAESAGA